MQNISQIYAELVRKGVKTIEQVPENIRAEVQEIVAQYKPTVNG
jgi:hypothetical protein